MRIETPISVSTISASGSKNIGSFSAELSITKGGNSRILLQFFVKSATSSNYNKYIGTDSISLGSANLNAMKYNVRAEDLSPDTYYIARAIIRDDYSRIHAVGEPILFKTDPVPSYSESEVSSAKDEGIATVTNDPASYSLVSKSAYDQALLDAKSAEQAIADAKVSAKAEGLQEGSQIGISEGEQSVTSNPSAYNLVTKSAYDQMVDDMIKKQSANATHYTEGWFYLPNRGWIWTNHSSYPYFYDAEDKDWMYFQSGQEKPRFYRYKTKSWLTIE